MRNFSVVHIEDKIKFLPIYQNRRKEELVIRMMFRKYHKSNDYAHSGSKSSKINSFSSRNDRGWGGASAGLHLNDDDDGDDEDDDDDGDDDDDSNDDEIVVILRNPTCSLW